MAILIGAYSCKKPCAEKGGPLSQEERSWFVQPNGGTAVYILEGTSTTDTVAIGVFAIQNRMGHFYREEHCEWGYEAGTQLVAPGVIVEVEHYATGTEGNLNSARIFGMHFSDYTPQNGVSVNGATYDAAYVMPGNPDSQVHDIVFNKAHGLIAYTRSGQRWLRVP